MARYGNILMGNNTANPAGYSKSKSKSRRTRTTARRSTYSKPARAVTARQVVKISKFSTMAWKSYHQNDEQTFSLVGNIAGQTKGILATLSNLPIYNGSSGAAQQKDVMQARQTDSVLIDKIKFQGVMRNTHNHAMTVRFLCFNNNSWHESLQYASASGQLTSMVNIFQNYTSKVDRPATSDGIDLAQDVFNKNLLSKSKDIYLDKTYFINPFQTPAGGSGGNSDSLSLRRFNFTLPIRRWYNYESKYIDGIETDVSKSGDLFFICLVGVADASNTGNTGTSFLDYRIATVFRENS